MDAEATKVGVAETLSAKAAATAKWSRSLRGLHGAMVEAVAGEAGLGAVAELAADAVGAPVAIVAPRLGGPWLAPAGQLGETELAVLVGEVMDRVADPRVCASAALVKEAPIVITGEVIGVVALLRERASSIAAELAADSAPAVVGALRIEGVAGVDDATVAPHATKVIHLAAMAALTGAVVAEARHEAERRLRGSLLEKLSREQLESAEIVREGARLGCRLDTGAVAISAELPVEHAQGAFAIIADECSTALAGYGDAPASEGMRRIKLLVPAEHSAEAALALARRLSVRLGRIGTVGMSSGCASPGALSRALGEAELMLELGVQAGAEIASGIHRNNATFRLLLRVMASHPEEVQLLYDDTVSPLVSYDEQYRTDLLTTLQAYLANNCNMNATAAAVYAHRHTIAYRLERIKELSGLDPSDSEDRERLGLGLKAYQMLHTQLPR
jgi:sugar diacid utilization regulator